jgi:hypothetical protein
VAVPGLLIGWHFLPGLLGDWIGGMLGVMTTPFFMESSFIILGFIVVICLNIWKRKQDGEELVYLEQVTGPDVPTDLPDHARWAIYQELPLELEPLSPLARAEGYFAIGDFSATAETISTMTTSELKSATTLQLRANLAKATGKLDLARELELEISQLPR